MKNLFEKVFIINLKFKKDRLDRLIPLIPTSLLNFEIWPAVHGDTVTPPSNWHSGNGAWGCYRSHMQILEHCISEKIESYIVIEDDSLFVDEFDEQIPNIINNLPPDWCQLYLGGQLLYEIKHPPKRINEYVYMPYNVNRTHCFAIHSRGYKRIYDHLFSLPFHNGDHIDHRLGRLHETGKFPVYCSNKWLVGQNDGPSNISGKTSQSSQFWHHPEQCAKDHWIMEKPLCIFLETTPEVATALQLKGWHQGGWKNEEGLDHGVCQALNRLDPEPRLKEWYDWIRREVIRDNLVMPCLWHPRLTWELVSKMKFTNWIHIKADTIKECIEVFSQHNI